MSINLFKKAMTDKTSIPKHITTHENYSQALTRIPPGLRARRNHCYYAIFVVTQAQHGGRAGRCSRAFYTNLALLVRIVRHRLVIVRILTLMYKEVRK